MPNTEAVLTMRSIPKVIAIPTPNIIKSEKVKILRINIDFLLFAGIK